MFDLLNAIEKQDILLVQSMLNNDPSLVTKFNPPSQIPLHKAVASGNAKIVEVVLEKLKLYPSAFENMMNATDENGDTILHVAAQYADFNTFSALVTALDKRAEVEVKQVNKHVYLPLQLVSQNKHSDWKDTKQVLEDLTIDKTAKSLVKPLNFFKIYEKLPFPLQQNKTLLENLHYGCIAASHVRRIIARSATHPSYNALIKKEQESIDSECRTLRQDYDNKNAKVVEKDLDTANFKKLENVVSTVKSYHLGNCYEHSCLVLEALIKMGCKTQAEIFHITNDDHVFLVFGRKENSDENDCTMWGAEAVVVDAWGGRVYPAIQIPDKLRGYYTYYNFSKDQYSCITFPYDSKYHKLQKHKDYRFSKTFFSDDHKDLNAFDASEVKEIQKTIKEIQETFNRQLKKNLRNYAFNSSILFAGQNKKQKMSPNHSQVRHARCFI